MPYPNVVSVSEHSAKQKWQRETHSATNVPGLSPLSDLSRSLHCHSSVAKGHLHTSLTSVSLVPVLHRIRPSTPFWPYGTHPFSLHFHYSSPTHFFISNSIHSRYSNETSQTLHVKDIHFPSLSTSHTPCICSVQRRWYNY